MKWEAQSPPDLLLTADHAELDGLLADAFEALKSGNGEQAFASVDLFWARLAMHIRAEHLHLFPAIEALPFAATDKAKTDTMLNELRSDHNFFMRELVAAIKLLRDETGGMVGLETTAESLRQVKDRLALHNEIEETRVYPLVFLRLPPDEAAALHSKMEFEITNMPPRFADSTETGL